MCMQESTRRRAEYMHSTCVHVYRGLRISCLLASLNEDRAGRRKQIRRRILYVIQHWLSSLYTAYSLPLPPDFTVYFTATYGANLWS